MCGYTYCVCSGAGIRLFFCALGHSLHMCWNAGDLVAVFNPAVNTSGM